MKAWKKILYALISGTILVSCSTTSRLGEGEVLYTGVKKMKIEPEEGVEVPGSVTSQVRSTLSVPANNSLYAPYIRSPFPIGLWVYNYMKPSKNTGLKHWIYEKLAKEPVLISTVQPELRLRVVQDILNNNGYFGSKTKYEILYNKKNKKKARINYWVEIAPAYTLDSIYLPENNTRLTQIIDSIYSRSPIQPGTRYCLDSLASVRNNVTQVVRNMGYYYFRPEYIEYLADTTQKDQRVDLKLILRKGIPAEALKAYRVGKINISLPSASGKGEWDTIRQRDMTVAFQKPIHLRKSVLPQNILLHTGQYFSVNQENLTQTKLTRLGIFRSVSVNVTPLDSLKGKDSLDVSIETPFDIPLEASLEANVSSKSNSYLGPGLVFGINHRNIFGGGEKLSVKLNGSYEWQTGGGSSKGKSSLFNSYEIGLNSTLSIPRLLGLKFMPHSRRFDTNTNFQLGANLLNRPHYFRMASFNISYGYDYQSASTRFHNLTIAKLTYTKLLNTTEAFDKTMEENPAIAMSFSNQFIPTSSYTYTFDNRHREKNDRWVWQISGTSAGNILWSIMEVFGKKGEKKLFGSPFSQFIKGTNEVKYYHRIRTDNWLATRLLIGAGYAYGNSKQMPYSEQFYIGGANSIRAFTIRSLGPGSYRPPADDSYGYFDQTGNFKLEANVEFRFKIAGNLHGAIFVDAGNIWLLKKDPLRPGGELNAKTFLKDIALGTGIGLRYDISMLVLRADLGIGIHTPYENPDKKSYYNMTSFKKSLAFHLAIGYPF